MNSLACVDFGTVFFGCCIAGAGKPNFFSVRTEGCSRTVSFLLGFTLLLPEVKGRDPDVIDAEERRADELSRS